MKKSTLDFDKWFRAQYGYGKLPSIEERDALKNEIYNIENALARKEFELQRLTDHFTRYDAASMAYVAATNPSKEFTKKKVRK
jgi:hypothetical protein